MNNGLRCDCEAEAEASKYLRAMKLSEACRTDTDLQQGVVYEDVLVLCLHHVVPLGPETRHVAVHVHGLLVLHPLQHGVYHNEGPGPAYPCTAVCDHRSTVRSVELVDPSDELEEGGAVLGYAVVRPGRELELLDLSPVCVTHLKHCWVRRRVQLSWGGLIYLMVTTIQFYLVGGGYCSYNIWASLVIMLYIIYCEVGNNNVGTYTAMLQQQLSYTSQ